MVQGMRPLAVACGARRLFAVAVSKCLLDLAPLLPDMCVKFCDSHGLENMGRLLAAPCIYMKSWLSCGYLAISLKNVLLSIF